MRITNFKHLYLDILLGLIISFLEPDYTQVNQELGPAELFFEVEKMKYFSQVVWSSLTEEDESSTLHCIGWRGMVKIDSK